MAKTPISDNRARSKDSEANERKLEASNRQAAADAASSKLLAVTRQAVKSGRRLGTAGVRVLNLLREAGADGAGMTAIEIMAHPEPPPALVGDLDGLKVKETRKRTREAMNVAAAGGDLCMAAYVGGGNSQILSYTIIPQATAELWRGKFVQTEDGQNTDTLVLAKLESDAKDFSFDGRTKGRFVPKAQK